MRCAIFALAVLTGCATSEPPQHPLAGTWRGNRTLTLNSNEYVYGSERGFWSADSRTLRYVAGAKPEEQCSFNLVGRNLTLGDCRLAGEYRRVDQATADPSRREP
jgi:hypothetical protein